MTSLFDFSDTAFLATFWAIIPSIALATLVYFRGHSTWLEKIFVLSSLVFVFWAFINYLSLQPDLGTLFLARLVLLFAVILQLMFLLLVYMFSGRMQHSSKIFFGFLTGLSVVTIIATQTPYMFTDIIFRDNQIVSTTGPLMPLFAFTVILLFALGGTHLVREIRKGEGDRKSQLIYIAVGYFIMFISLILTQFIFVTVFQTTKFLPFGPLLTIPFLIMASYAMFKHNLFNIRVITTEIFTAIVILIFTVNVFFSTTIIDFIINSILLALIIVFGILLIRGTFKEIQALRELSDTKSEFISIASHQLRTPLTAIKGYISMIMEGTYGQITPEQKETLSKVYASNERLVRLVNDLLNVSRIEQGRLMYTYAQTHIPKMIENIVTELAISAKFKNLELRWQNPQGTEKFIAWADESKLRQSVLNLLDNAIKYTEKGFVEIKLEQDINPTLMRITVKDTGAGLSARDKEKIFKRFSRGEDSSKLNAGGSGLGLFVAKKMVEGNKGHIWAESAGEGRGSEFIITIPFYKEKSV